MPMNASGSASARHFAEILDAHAGVDQHRHGGDLEERERQREEVGTAAPSARVRVPRVMPSCDQAVRERVATGVQFGEGDACRMAAAYAGTMQRRAVGLARPPCGRDARRR